MAAKVSRAPKRVSITPIRVRTGRQDVRTPARKDVTLRAEALSAGGRLTKVAFELLRQEFPEQDLKKNFVLRQLKSYREQISWFHRDARYKLERGVRIPCGKLERSVWQFDKRRGRPCPEAGTELWYQHDGARPHTARANTRPFATQSKTRGFRIQVLVQPPQSPDVNIDDLAFFASLQSDVSLVSKETRRDLLEAVVTCWEAYPLERMTAVWRCLYASYHGILSAAGGNDYEKHRGSRRQRSAHADDRFNRDVKTSAITAAEQKLDEMKTRLFQPTPTVDSSSSDSDESSDSDSG